MNNTENAQQKLLASLENEERELQEKLKALLDSKNLAKDPAWLAGYEAGFVDGQNALATPRKKRSEAFPVLENINNFLTDKKNGYSFSHTDLKKQFSGNAEKVKAKLRKESGWVKEDKTKKTFTLTNDFEPLLDGRKK